MSAKPGRPRHLDLWLVYVMALAGGLPPRAVNALVMRLGLPARDAAQITTGHGTASAILRRLTRRPPPKPSAIYCLLAGLGDETVCFLIAKARPDSVRRRLLVHLACNQDVKLSLTGADLKALGLKPGPRYKKILDRLLEARLDGEVKSETDERKLVERLARS